MNWETLAVSLYPFVLQLAAFLVAPNFFTGEIEELLRKLFVKVEVWTGTSAFSKAAFEISAGKTPVGLDTFLDILAKKGYLESDGGEVTIYKPVGLVPTAICRWLIPGMATFKSILIVDESLLGHEARHALSHDFFLRTFGKYFSAIHWMEIEADQGISWRNAPRAFTILGTNPLCWVPSNTHPTFPTRLVMYIVGKILRDEVGK